MHTSAKPVYGVTDDLLGGKSEPQFPSNISTADSPKSFVSFMHNKIVNNRRELSLGTCDYDPLRGTQLTSFVPVSEDFMHEIRHCPTREYTSTHLATSAQIVPLHTSL